MSLCTKCSSCSVCPSCTTRSDASVYISQLILFLEMLFTIAVLHVSLVPVVLLRLFVALVSNVFNVFKYDYSLFTSVEDSHIMTYILQCLFVPNVPVVLYVLVVPPDLMCLLIFVCVFNKIVS